MKHIVTNLEGSNEPINYTQEELWVFLLETLFGCYQFQTSTIPPNTQLELPVQSPGHNNEISALNLHNLDPPSLSAGIWTLYYDESKTPDRAGAGCVLVDPKGNRFLISCRLEFKCTNNTAAYEALSLKLKKAIDLKADCLKVIGDS